MRIGSSISRRIRSTTRAKARSSLMQHSLKTRFNGAMRGASTAAGDGGDGSAPKKLWGGRFTGATDPLMEAFNQSIDFDKRLWEVDIRGSLAYSRALHAAGILSKEECDAIDTGLQAVAEEWRSGIFEIRHGDEDIHTANERRLSEIIGAPAGKLHTGRSRNDQVATDFRLWLLDEVDTLQTDLTELIRVGAKRAEEEVDIIMPGYTHLQPAQPVRWSHWIISHAVAWQRDADRLVDLRKRVDCMPLGSGALAGHPLGIDREALAKDLGFSRISPNSMDAVSDRDFVAEFLFFNSMAMVHLSRFAEDLIIYGSSEFGFVRPSDAYSTGSSLMPQKKNPDALELLRGKAGASIGPLVSVLSTLKGIPSTYNKDLQECWQPLFGAVDNLGACVKIATGVLSTIEPVPGRMRSSLAPEMLATDLADYLVKKGVPFRTTHHIAGEAVSLAEKRGCSLTDLSDEDLHSLHESFEEGAGAAVFSMDASVEERSAAGGTAKGAVLEQARSLLAWCEARD